MCKKRKILLARIRWLENEVIPGFSRQGSLESVRRCLQQIKDIEWCLQTEPPRDPPNAYLDKPYQERARLMRAKKTRRPEVEHA